MIYWILDQLSEFWQNGPGVSSCLSCNFLGHPLWRYGAYLFWLFVGWFAIRFIERQAESKLHVWLKHHRESFGVRVVERLIMPLRIAILVSLLFVGLDLFDLCGDTPLILQIYTLAMGLCTTIALIRIVDVMLWRWKHNYRHLHHQEPNAQLYTLIDKGSQLLIVITMTLTTLHNMGLNITSLLASLSIGSLAFALAAQDTLGNLFGAISILADDTFQVGDIVRIDSVEGSVESIGLRSTIVRNKEGYAVTIPNKSIGAAIVINLSNRTLWKQVFSYPLDYSLSKEQLILACQLLDQIFHADVRTEKALIGFKLFGSDGLHIEVKHAYKANDDEDYINSLHKFNLAIKEAFDREKIAFALPSLNVHIAKNE